MIKSATLFTHVIAALVFSLPAAAKVYKNKPVGVYAASYDLKDHKGKTFLSFMKEKVYPTLAKEAAYISGNSRDFLGAIERGEGVEIRLTEDVTTLHVKYQNPFSADNPERSGRSFAVVGNESKNYVADASYAHYLNTLEELSFGDERELRQFYKAILSILANNDPSHLEELGFEAKQVAADFVAVYVAEQYRHLINGKDPKGNAQKLGVAKLGSGHNWDDAHLQVTLLAAFHGGQSDEQRFMVYEGKLTNQVFDQDACLYNRFDSPERNSTQTREMKLFDYWQFSYRNECPGRSGVNVTRTEFEKMGWLMTETMADLNDRAVRKLTQELGLSKSENLVKQVAKFFVNNKAADRFPDDGESLVDAILEFVMSSHKLADKVTLKLLTMTSESTEAP